MKFLALPGAYGSAAHFKTQLQPLVSQLEKQAIAEFTFTQGRQKMTPPPGFEEYFGPPPLYRFLDFAGLEVSLRNLQVPTGEEPEDTIRLLTDNAEHCPWHDVEDAMEPLFQILEADPDIQGIMGYSEGVTIGATLIMEETRRAARDGRPRRIKCAIFLAGWPPLCERKGGARPLLADETENMLDVPTLHVIGCDDPFLAGAMSLYNMCDEDTAELFDHGKGHTVPRDAGAVKLLCEATRRLVDRASHIHFP